jgi:hypothetical protein
MASLSILCVSQCKPRALPFIQGHAAHGCGLGRGVRARQDGVDVHSKGYFESALEDALNLTHGDYVLRLDDDERCSRAMLRWLELKKYEEADHWSFPRIHLWRDPFTMIREQYYWPDLQTRCSVRAKAGGRSEIHAGSPFGAGTIARVCIEHFVYLVKPYEERIAIAENYHRIRHGADGGPFRASAIEDEHPEGVNFMEYDGEGEVPFVGRTWFGGLKS